MSYVFFFSYARENLDKELKAFFEDLGADVAPHVPGFAANDAGFRDQRDLHLMDTWEPTIMDALQTSAVLVCVTSISYFQKRFCGQEYWVFDQRRRQNLAPESKPPAVVLPVIWAPMNRSLPPYLDEVQWSDFEIPELYKTKGLRYLKRFERAIYKECVNAMGEAIGKAYNDYPGIPALGNLVSFNTIPNRFAGGQWEEAADPTGWLPGPGVANFVFAAAGAQQLLNPPPPGRYGTAAADWRPYLPPVAKTVGEIALEAAHKHSLRYREIVVDQQLQTELANAKDRKNLTLVLVDANTVSSVPLQSLIKPFDAETRPGAALLIPWSDGDAQWTQKAVPTLATTFPIKSVLSAPAYQGPIKSASELETFLDVTLADLSSSLTRAEAEKKSKTDEAPAQVVGST